jgi:hypothetical protein
MGSLAGKDGGDVTWSWSTLRVNTIVLRVKLICFAGKDGRLVV